MQLEYILEGLDCPNCAARIQAEVGKLPEVQDAQINLVKQILTVEAGKD